MALPLRDAMSLRRPLRAAERAAAVPRRMVAVCSNLGYHTPFLYPEKAGKDYVATPYLEVLAPLRDQVTVFSGLSHPGVDGGHMAEMSFLTAAPPPGAQNFKNTVSLVQLMAERIGTETRFASLTLNNSGGLSLSWTRGGVRIPSEGKPSRVFERLFLPGGGGATQRLRNGESIMDLVGEEAKQMQREVGPADRQKLDEYFTSVRELEDRLVRGQEWSRKPKPKVDAKPPVDITDNGDLYGQIRLMYDVMHLALKTDSTRIITLYLGGGGGVVPKIDGVADDWHNLSHHGQDPIKLEQLKRIEVMKFEALRDFLLKLQASEEQGQTLLDRTSVLFGSHLGNASNHNTKNLPIVLAGGGFRHGQHLAFDRLNNTPLANVFVSLLQRMDLDIDAFGTSTGTMTGLST